MGEKMEFSNNGKCPHCSRPLTPDETGRIGFCKTHKWIALGEGNTAYASQKNASIIKEKDESIRRREAEKEEQKRLSAEKEYKRNVKMIVMTLAVIVLIGVITFFVLLRPKMIYSDAQEAFINGDYSSAISKYEKIKEYKDSEIRLQLCTLLVNINDNDKVIENFSTLMEYDLPDDVVSEVQNILYSWEEYGLKPNIVLNLIEKIEDERIERERVYIYAHVSMLPDSIAYILSKDEPDILVSLTSNLKVECYQMISDGNKQVYIDKDKTNAYLIEFGKQFEEKNILKAIDCYFEAYATTSDESVINTIVSAIDSLPIGLERIIERHKLYKVAPQSSIKNLVIKDIADTLSPSNITNCTAEDIIEITNIVKTEELGVSTVNIDKVYSEAVLSLAGSKLVGFQFVDWNKDRMEEFVSLTEAGTLSYHDYLNESEVSFNTGFKNGSLSIYDDVILVKSESSDGFGIFTYESGTVIQRVLQNNVLNLNGTERDLTYSKKLPGSIERLEHYHISLQLKPISATRVKLDWNKEAYKLPSTCEETVVRWLETITYDIPEEKALLEKSSNNFNAPKPSDLTSIQTVEYFNEENANHVFVTYNNIEGKDVILSIKCVPNGNSYVVSNIENIESAINIKEIITANKEITGNINNENESTTYTLIIPVDSKINLFWQSGDSDGSNTTYRVSLHTEDLKEQIFSYDLVESKMVQQSYPTFLEKGIYKVVVRAISKKTKEYRLRIDSLCVDSIEKEPNDNYDVATPVSLNETRYGSLSSSTDKDFYSFELAKDSKVNISAYSPEDGNKKDKLSFTVYDAESHKILHSFKITGIADKVNSCNLYLRKGKYLILAEKGDYYSQQEYSLSVLSSSELVQEVEDNDSRKTATKLNLGTKITGSLAVLNDSDWFSFTIQYPMIVKANLGFSPVESSMKTYVVTLLSNEGEIAKWNISGTSGGVALNPIILNKGDYFIRIDSVQYNPKDYSILLQGEKVELIEEEPNNKSASANTLPINKTLTGYSSDITDIDCYKVSLKDGNYLIDLSFDSSKSTSNRYSFSIEKDGTTLYRQSIKDNSGGFSNLFGFEEGDYILKLQPSYEICNVYSLRVSKK